MVEPTRGTKEDSIGNSLKQASLESRIDRIESLIGQTASNVSHLTSTVADLSHSFAAKGERPQNPSHLKKRKVDADAPELMGEQIQSFIENAVMGFRKKPGNRPSMYNSTVSRDTAERYLTLVPGDQHAIKLLVDFYFENVDWMSRVFHPERSYSFFLNLRSLSPSEIASQCRPSSICCYLMVIVLSLHFATQDILHALNFTEASAHSLCDRILEGCYELLFVSDFVGSGELEHLACFVLMTIYLHDRKGYSRDQWVLLGTAIRVAQRLGCHRLDDKNSLTALHPRFARPVERELGRRIYWNLIWHDWSHSSANYGVYSIHPTQSRTDLPTNAIISGSEVIPKSLEEYTPALFLIFSARYVDAFRQTVDECNQNGGIIEREHIEIYTDLFNKIRGSVPDCLKYKEYGLDHAQQTASERSRLMESVTLELMYHNRLLRLNRTFQLAGYQDDRWRFARLVSVNAAQRIILILEKVSERLPIILNFWLISLYILGASTTLLIELCCSTDATSNLGFCREYIKVGVRLLQSVSKSSEAAKCSLLVVNELLSAESKIRELFSQTENVNKMAEAARVPEVSAMKSLFYDILGKALRDQAQGEVGFTGDQQHAFRDAVALADSVLPDFWNESADNVASYSHEKVQNGVLEPEEATSVAQAQSENPIPELQESDDALFRVLAWTFGAEDIA